MKATSSSLLTAAVASLTLFGCNRGGENLAIVNGEAITMDEFHRYLERKPTVQVTFPQQGTVQGGQQAELPVVGSVGFQGLRDLVNRRILLQVAKDKGVMPKEGDVAKELDFQKKTRPNFVTDLVNKGMSLEEIRRDLTLDIAKENIVTQGIVVTSAEADTFIKENPAQFEIPPQARVRIVVASDEAKKKLVDRDIAAGVPFATVAQTYSSIPTARTDQGLVQNTDVSKMPPFLQEMVRTTPERTASGWVAVEGQNAKIYVELKVPAKKLDINDTMRETVRRQLRMQKGSEATDLGKQLVKKLQAAKIEVILPSLKTPWDEAWKQLKETDVEANTRTGATGAPTSTTAGTPVPTTAGAPKPNSPPAH